MCVCRKFGFSLDLLEPLKIPREASPPCHVTACPFLFDSFTSWCRQVSSPGPALCVTLMRRCYSPEPHTLLGLRKYQRRRPGLLRQENPWVLGAPRNHSWVLLGSLANLSEEERRGDDVHCTCFPEATGTAPPTAQVQQGKRLLLTRVHMQNLGLK